MRDKLNSTQKQPAYQPDWITHEVHQALEKVTGEHVGKKQRTVLLLATAIAADTPQADVFRRHDTCNRVTWYGRDGEPGWRDDQAIKEALEVCTKRARWWMRVREGRAVQSALDTLTGAADEVAAQLVRIAIEGRATVINGETRGFVEADVKDIIKAADSILDRVDEKTADKGTANTVIKLTWGESGEEEV